MSTKEEKIKSFDPNSLGERSNNIYGLPFTEEEAETVVIPVPWDVTVSYSEGTANGPEAVFEASFQVDLFDPYVKDAWKAGIAMLPIDEDLKTKSTSLRVMSKEYIDKLEDGVDMNEEEMQGILKVVNHSSKALNEEVKARTSEWLKKGKLVALLGGDHSTPLGFMEALGEVHGSFDILQLDAHADLRESYEGFEFSHASIMYNALKLKSVNKLVQAGIRDYCEAEFDIIQKSNGRVVTFFDRDIRYRQFEGQTWKTVAEDIISKLGNKVYISFDIDGLDPKLCPNTGTPVAGGFEFEQAVYLVERLVESGKKIIGLDVNEVAPGENEWDANVGARLLYRLCNLMARSNGRC